MDSKEETIAAIATPLGVGGIGIIRISGYNAETITKKIFRSKRPIDTFKRFRLYLGHIIDPESGIFVDEVLLSVMHAPCSYTREDVVEINSHSGYTILSTILEIVLQAGARLARPGEFTLRAFLNGRIDLTQAEAIIDLVNAKGDISIQMAARQLAGGLKQEIEQLRQGVIRVLAQIEASLDFPDEESTIPDRSHLEEQITDKALGPAEELVSACSQRKAWHEGFTVVIVGRVNVGKSSILNRLSQQEKAIVTPIPGTTRDILEAMIIIHGLPIKLVDTAGMRQVKGQIEKEGVERTRTQLASADITLLVIDRSRPLNQHDRDLIRTVNSNNTVVVVNKIDLPGRVNKKGFDALVCGLTKVEVSALTGEGFCGLSEAIYEKIMSKTTDLTPPPIVPNIRHKILLAKAVDHLKDASRNLLSDSPLELVATDLTWAVHAFDEITGNRINEEILDAVFSDFCLGK
jgi:tRNA modification GTPase